MKLFIARRAEKELDKLPDSLAKNILEHILLLAKNPYPPNSKKLKGINNFRLRIGSFKVLYWINTKKKELTILRIADRKTIYRGMD